MEGVRMNRTVSLAIATVGAMVLVTTSLLAEERSCRGLIGLVTLDNLRVPAGARCTLDRTRLQGSIVVERGATLQATGIRVNGNIQAEGARAVHVNRGSVIGGSVQVKQGVSAIIDSSWVNADIQFDSNAAGLSATRNNVGGSVQVFSNQGGVTLSGNTIDGNLQCKENTPRPTGGGNVVQGNKEDQCSRL
jgi:hypothetical protein